MTIIIEVKPVRKHGLDTWNVYVDGTLLNTFMSKAAAETKKHNLLYAWNVEKVGQRNNQRKVA